MWTTTAIAIAAVPPAAGDRRLPAAPRPDLVAGPAGVGPVAFISCSPPRSKVAVNGVDLPVQTADDDVVRRHQRPGHDRPVGLELPSQIPVGPVEAGERPVGAADVEHLAVGGRRGGDLPAK